MSDQFDSLFDGLRGQSPPTSFAPAEAVRRRGRQRTNRQVAAVGFAVLAVTGLGAGGIATAVTQPDPKPAPPAATRPVTPSPEPTEPSSTPTPSHEPTDPPVEELEPSDGATEPPPPSTIPGDWLLVAADLAGDGWEQTGNELLEGAWYWDGSEAWCPEYRTEDYSSLQQRVDTATVGWQRPGEALERVDQLVELFSGGGAAVNIDDVRAYVELCSRAPSEGDQVAPTEYEIEDSGFAEDESLLIRVQEYHFNEDDEIVPGEDHHVAVVRVGDAVTTIVYRAGGDVYQIAQSAAARLQ